MWVEEKNQLRILEGLITESVLKEANPVIIHKYINNVYGNYGDALEEKDMVF